MQLIPWRLYEELDILFLFLLATREADGKSARSENLDASNDRHEQVGDHGGDNRQADLLVPRTVKVRVCSSDRYALVHHIGIGYHSNPSCVGPSGVKHESHHIAHLDGLSVAAHEADHLDDDCLENEVHTSDYDTHKQTSRRG